MKNSEKLNLHKILAGFISYSTLEIGRCVLRTNAKSNSEILTVNFEPEFSFCVSLTQCFHFLRYFYFVSLCA